MHHQNKPVPARRRIRKPSTAADIILYQPRSARAKYRVPMSLLALASMLEGAYDYAIVDGNFFHEPVRQLGEIIARNRSRFLGMTVMPGPQLQEAVPVARAMRQRFPELTIAWGGYFPSNYPEVVLRSGLVDFVFRGPVEREFRRFIDAWHGDRDFSGIRSLSYRANGQIVHQPLQMPLLPMDELPAWPYHRVGDMRKYLGRTVLGERTMAMHTSYGCPFTCGFCGIVPIYNGRWVARSAEWVAAEVEMIQRQFGADAIEFTDNNFFTSMRRVAEFSELLLQKRIRVSWWGEARPDTLMKYPDAVLRNMRRSGCKMIFLGAESGSALRLQQMNKGGSQTPETILRLAERFREHDIIPEFSFVLGAPAENVDAAIDEEIAFIRKVKRVNPASEIIIYVYAPVPLQGASLLAEAQKSGFRFPETLDDWLRPEWSQHDLRRNPMTPWLQPRHLAKIHNFETVLNARYPTISDIKLKPWHRRLLQIAGTWRYTSGVHRAPYEIKILQRMLRYRQPEEEGF